MLYAGVKWLDSFPTSGLCLRDHRGCGFFNSVNSGLGFKIPDLRCCLHMKHSTELVQVHSASSNSCVNAEGVTSPHHAFCWIAYLSSCSWCRATWTLYSVFWLIKRKCSCVFAPSYRICIVSWSKAGWSGINRQETKDVVRSDIKKWEIFSETWRWNQKVGLI